MWTVFPGRIAPAQAIPINKDDATQYAAVIDAGCYGSLGKGPQTLHLFARQSVQVVHLQSPYRTRTSFPHSRQWALGLSSAKVFLSDRPCGGADPRQKQEAAHILDDIGQFDPNGCSDNTHCTDKQPPLCFLTNKDILDTRTDS